jgi:hypothetical protein
MEPRGESATSLSATGRHYPTAVAVGSAACRRPCTDHPTGGFAPSLLAVSGHGSALSSSSDNQSSLGVPFWSRTAATRNQSHARSR